MDLDGPLYDVEGGPSYDVEDGPSYDIEEGSSHDMEDGPSHDLDDPMDVDNDQPQNFDSKLDLLNPSDPGETQPGNVKEFLGASKSFLHGITFMDQFFSDKYGELCKENLYYLFTLQQDWQLVSWLLQSHLSMAVIDSFLSLQLVIALTNVIIYNWSVHTVSTD